MIEQAQIPCYPEDRKQFKIAASNRGISMKDLFREWVEKNNNGGDGK